VISVVNEKILVVEDEFITGTDIQNNLKTMGYDVPVVVDTGEGAIKKAGELHPDLVLMDITLIGDMNGIEAAAQIRERYGIPVIFLTAHSDDTTITRALESEPFGYIVKPFEERNLKSTIKMALFKYSMDQKLKERDRIIYTLMNATADATALLDLEGRILAANAAFAQRLGKPPGSILNTIIYEYIQTSGISQRCAEELTHCRAGTPVRLEEEVQGKTFDTTLYPAMDDHGVMTSVALFSHDITALKKVEAELKAVNEQLQQEKEQLLLITAALNAMNDCAVITNHLGTIVHINSLFERKFGLSDAEVKGKHISEFAHEENRLNLSQEFFISYRESDWAAVFVAKNKYGVKLPMTIKGNPILYEGKRPKYFVFVMREKI
jgi:PAS domain S-box-containing protein